MLKIYLKLYIQNIEALNKFIEIIVFFFFLN